MRITSILHGDVFARAAMLCALLMAGIPNNAGATDLPQIVHARQEHFRSLGRTSKWLRDQIERSQPDWNRAEYDARRIQKLATALPRWFPAGSGRGHGVKTRARRAIWAHPRQFAQAAQLLFDRAQNLSRAAASHDRRELMVRARALGQACASCHRRFRTRHSWW